MESKPNLVKAEVLITRKCQLKCKGCKIPDNKHTKELTIEEWKRAFRIVYEDLNADFQAIYGGDPTMLGREGLKEVVKELSSYRSQGKSYTIISNCLALYNNGQLDEKYMRELMDAGLDSWTASIDTLENDTTIGNRIKSHKGLEALLKFKELGLRDCCGIITVSKNNLNSMLKTIKYLNQKGLWVGLDFIHYKKCRGQIDLPSRYDVENLIFNPEDLISIQTVANEIIKLKKDGGLIFPTFEVLENWGKYGIDLNWQCQQPIRSITLDSDGSLMQCDSFRGDRIKKYTIFDLPEKWQEFQRDYFKDIKEQNCQCFWSTHAMLFDEDRKTKRGIDYYQHKTK